MHNVRRCDYAEDDDEGLWKMPFAVELYTIAKTGKQPKYSLAKNI